MYVIQWRVHWFHRLLDLWECWTSVNTLLHQIRQTLPFPPPFSLTLITTSISFSSFPLLLCSVYLQQSSHLSLNSCSEVSFFFSKTPFSFCPFTSFPFRMQIRDDSTCMDIYTHKTYICMRMIKKKSQDVYCTWTDNRIEPAHKCCIFRLKLWIASRPEKKTY